MLTSWTYGTLIAGIYYQFLQLKGPRAPTMQGVLSIFYISARCIKIYKNFSIYSDTVWPIEDAYSGQDL